MIVEANGSPVLHPKELDDLVRKSGPTLKLTVVDPRTDKSRPSKSSSAHHADPSGNLTTGGKRGAQVDAGPASPRPRRNSRVSAMTRSRSLSRETR